MKKTLTLLLCLMLLFTISGCGKKEDEKKDNNKTKEPRNENEFTVVDETEICADALEFVYQDDDYKYYFPCIKSESVFIVFTNGDRISIKEAMEVTSVDWMKKVIEKYPDLFQKVEIKEEKEKHVVTFNSDGGSSVVKQSVEEGNKATKPKDPTKKDYTFIEWQLDGKKYDFNTIISKDIALKAIWKKNEVSNNSTENKKYTVTIYRGNVCDASGEVYGVRVMETLSVESGKTFTRLPYAGGYEGYSHKTNEGTEWERYDGEAFIFTGKTSDLSDGSKMTTEDELGASWNYSSPVTKDIKLLQLYSGCGV